ncbi:hypothetical protein CDAR_116031 [Caerostris darwini]|uniref:Uncharacterized protein n=1 Tax=Caerostris darwini TaxID=1538125 RepID=A0AAV4NDB0_9ARAC|nr:hypothetical protein CDAR_116031 [Caerostris darwini]
MGCETLELVILEFLTGFHWMLELLNRAWNIRICGGQKADYEIKFICAKVRLLTDVGFCRGVDVLMKGSDGVFEEGICAGSSLLMSVMENSNDDRISSKIFIYSRMTFTLKLTSVNVFLSSSVSSSIWTCFISKSLVPDLRFLSSSSRLLMSFFFFYCVEDDSTIGFVESILSSKYSPWINNLVPILLRLRRMNE